MLILAGLGTIINTIAIIIGGIFGVLFGKLINERIRNTLCIACGICVMFIGLSGALEGLLEVTDGSVVSTNSMLLVGCLCIGAFLGELINIEDAFEKFGEWLKHKTGNAKDAKFVDGFVSASLTVCIGAIKDGIEGDITILVTKSILDLIIILVMAGSQGVGCIFSAIPVAVFQGSVTALSSLIKPIMTPLALSNLSFVGSVLIFCVGINLVFGKKVRVANLLPAVVVAVISAFLPL